MCFVIMTINYENNNNNTYEYIVVEKRLDWGSSKSVCVKFYMVSK